MYDVNFHKRHATVVRTEFDANLRKHFGNKKSKQHVNFYLTEKHDKRLVEFRSRKMMSDNPSGHFRPRLPGLRGFHVVDRNTWVGIIQTRNSNRIL